MIGSGAWVVVWLVATPVAQEPLSDALQALVKVAPEGGLSQAQRDAFEAMPAHAKRLFDSAATRGLLGSVAQVQALLSLELAPEKIELLLEDNCVLCHTNPDAQSDETLLDLDPTARGAPAHLDLRAFASDVHLRRGLSCSGCHGGAPTDEEMVAEIYQRWPKAPVRHEDRTWIPEFCARCHGDPGRMRQFNPALPTDQLAKYRYSRHGELLLGKHDSKAAQCVSCHGSHGIQSAKNRGSKVHAQRVPGTCGQCHADAAYMAGYKTPDGKPLPTNQLAQYKESVHGRALLERGDLGAPACNDCHGNHAALPPSVANVAQVCRTCHAGNGAFFDGSRHKKAFDTHGWPECGTCHMNHAIQKTNDSMLSVAPGGLCRDCHAEYAKENKACIETASYFHETIVHLASELEHFTDEKIELAERGLDVEPLTAALSSLDESLRQARSHIHTFDRSDFEQVVTPGRESIAIVGQLVIAADEELRFRRNGLVIAIGIMVLVALLLWLKIRQLGG